MDSQALIAQLADTARLAARSLSTASGSERKGALEMIAQALIAKTPEILAANEIDMENARKDQMHPQMQDRLLLTKERVLGMAEGAKGFSSAKWPTAQASYCAIRSNWHGLRSSP
jgi:glutamate-5-semialdehyde dehydrogenase